MHLFIRIGLLLLCVAPLRLWAQGRTVSGKVTDASDGSTLPGVNVVLKGTSSGVVTDIEGNYTIGTANAGSVLVFSFMGMKTQEEPIGARTTINVAMASDVAQLSEVLVTAQGIERKKEALGFAVSSVDQSSIADKTEGDVVRSLRSKASGVQITQQSGLSGSGSNIIIRGYTSITGTNQPLFIVDGVPFNTNNNSTAANEDNPYAAADGQNNGSSRFLDLDPENIESINILKGFAAATLYGMQGRNGVILVTTKTGSSKEHANRKMSISVTQSLFANQIASLPDYQKKFGNGFDQAYGLYFSNWGPGFYRDGLGGWGRDPSIAPDGTVNHPYSNFTNPALRTAFPQYQPGQPGNRYAYKPYDNVKNFFRTGLVSSTSVNARGVSRDGNSTYGIGFGYLNDEGFTPGNTLERISLSVGGSAKLLNRFKIHGTMNLVRTNYHTPPISTSIGNGAYNARPGSTGAPSSSVFGHLFFTPRSIDLMNLPFEHPVTKQSVYYRNGNDIQNPLWTVKNAFVSQLNHRIFGSAGISYSFNDNLDIFYRLGYDVYSERNESGQNKGGVEGPLNGAYTSFDNVNVIWDHTLALNGNYKLGQRFTLGFNVGVTARRTAFTQQGSSSVNQLQYGIFRHFNFTSSNPIQRTEEQNIIGVYGQVESSYKDFLFLTVAMRNDFVSNFSPKYRQLFYPSVSLSLLVTELFPGIVTTNGLNFLKLRAGFGTSAGFTGGYPTASVVHLNPRAFTMQDGAIIPSSYTGATLGNVNLRPERQEEFEVGFESTFWDGRINLDFSWYSRQTTDLIINRPLDPATGYASVYDNLGKVVNRGVEIDLGADLVKTRGFTWNLKANLTHNRSNVEDIGNTDKLLIAGLPSLGNFATPGEQMGVIMGSRIARAPDGQWQVNSTGQYVAELGTFKIGDPNPDFTCNFTNTFSYKGIALSAVINWVQGGDIVSFTTSSLYGRGVTTDTDNRLRPFVLPGVRNIAADGQPPQYVKNDIMINNSSLYFSNIAFGPDELLVYDATCVRLQEISLSYSLPKKLLEKTPFGSITFVASGYNLWYRAVNMPKGVNFDPNVAGLGVGNGQGFDYINGPSSRRFGGTIKFTF